VEEVTEKIGDIAVVLLPGKKLDAGNAQEFKTNVAPILRENAKIVFDLSNLDFVDSSGLGTIFSCLRQVTASGGDLKLCAMSKQVHALFELVRMNRVFDIYTTKDEAINAF